MVDMLDAIGKGFSATEIMLGQLGARMVPAPPALARSALVHVRLGLRRGAAGAHAERTREARRFAVDGNEARRRAGVAFQGRRTLRRAGGGASESSR